ncbi:MAG: GDSL-type esterase/lipase family protein, partial [Kiritimatiellia bacterium]
MLIAVLAALSARAEVELQLSQNGLVAKCTAPGATVNVGWPRMTGKGESRPKVTRLSDREAELVYPSGAKWVYRLDEKGRVTLHPAGARVAEDKGISHQLVFSTSVADGSSRWSLNGGEAKPLPKEKEADPFLFKSDFKSFSITDASGAGFCFRLPYGWAQFQDNRHWNNNRTFFYKSFSDLPKDGDYVFAFEDATGADVKIAAAVPLDPFAYVPYPEAKEELWPGKGPIRTFGWQEGIRKNYAARHAKDANAVFFIGDSLTENWRTIAQDLAPIKVANRGLGGDTSRGCLFRLPFEVLAHQPAAVVIAAGTNDLTAHGAPEECLYNLKAMVDLCRRYDRRMPVFLCTLPPASHPNAPLKPGAREAVNAGIRALCAEQKCILVDREAFAVDAKGEQDLSLYSKDRLHFGPKGYEKWTAAMKAVLNDASLAEKLGDTRYAPREKLDLTE